MNTTRETPVRVPAFSTVTKRLGNWTTARDFQVRAHRGDVVLDLRSPRIPYGDVRVHVDLDHSVLKLLIASDAVIDDWELRRRGRGRVKDAEGRDAAGNRRVVIIGETRDSEIRILRNGLAILTAMCSKEYLADVRRAFRQGGRTTVHDPARTV